jgi:hypothetical protein
VERTLFDLATTGRARTLDLAIDAALRLGTTDLVQLRREAELVAKRGRAGTVLYRAALEARTPGEVLPESAPERLLARALVEQGLPEPDMQHVVRDSTDAFVARVDLAYPNERLLIEYESFEHHTGTVALVRDSARRNVLVGLGFVVLSATAADVRDHARRLACAIRNARDRRRA